MSSSTLAADAAIDPSRWPDVVAVPDNPLRGRIAERLTKRAVKSLPIRVTTADGKRFGGGTMTDPDLHLIRPDDFYRRLAASGLIGFGESYMAGDWTSEDLAGVLTIMASRMATLIPPLLQRLRSAVVHARPSVQDNTLDGSRQNIHRHYDLSNELFELFLDPSLTYSAAVFEADPAGHGEDLNAAQHRKIDRLLTIAGVTEGSTVLEIGTGWGELGIRAAQRGARVTTVTISTEQAELATKRIAEAGCTDQVEVRLQDYREVTGTFDALVSVEMIEAVGANHWDEYFGAIQRLLKPGGRAGLQAITMPHDRMIASLNTYTWIVKYIFPGGQLPSVPSVRQSATDAGLTVASEFTFGLHYAETLRRWRATFEANASQVGELSEDFDLAFRRMWSLYLAYSEAGFRSRYLDVVQFGLTKAAH
ncbi:MAG: cyclopropane-fatty-acyl-phospholipid synthase family protein [Actinomycetota bacterium]|nr:cyclopropane-fatty-acyl-phospholipid synthase family protein [Actinomycetota bacterium]MDQ2957872.1 cyclopropane-fatty-acyl-phospholipid synthase family protein [Actinomycetota bacterium]